MGKYTCASEAIAGAVERGSAAGFDHAEMLEAVIVQAVDDLKRVGGVDAVRATLTYELDNNGGRLDTVFLRAR